MEMPCGTNHSCNDCIHYIMVTRNCIHLDRMKEDEREKLFKLLNK